MGLDLVIFTIVIGADKQKGKNENETNNPKRIRRNGLD